MEHLTQTQIDLEGSSQDLQDLARFLSAGGIKAELVPLNQFSSDEEEQKGFLLRVDFGQKQILQMFTTLVTQFLESRRKRISVVRFKPQGGYERWDFDGVSPKDVQTLLDSQAGPFLEDRPESGPKEDEASP